VRVKFTLSPTGSSLPPPSSIKELQSQKDCHQAPIRDTSEPYSSSGLLHTRNEFGHNCQVIHRACSILATAPQAAKVRKPLQCSCRTQKSRGFPGYSSSSSMNPRFPRRKEPDCPVIILFRYSECENIMISRTSPQFRSLILVHTRAGCPC